MCVLKIRLNNITDVINFTNICNQYKGDIDLYIGSIHRDAKSFNSNLEFIGQKDLCVVNNFGDKNIIADFENDIRKWIVEE